METPINNQEETEFPSRTEICAPNCPGIPRPYPHPPFIHIPLFPTDWCKETEVKVDEESLPF